MPGRFAVRFAEKEAGWGDISVQTDVLDAGESPTVTAKPLGGGKVPSLSHLPVFRTAGVVGMAF